MKKRKTVQSPQLTTKPDIIGILGDIIVSSQKWRSADASSQARLDRDQNKQLLLAARELSSSKGLIPNSKILHTKDDNGEVCLSIKICRRIKKRIWHLSWNKEIRFYQVCVFSSAKTERRYIHDDAHHFHCIKSSLDFLLNQTYILSMGL